MVGCFKLTRLFLCVTSWSNRWANSELRHSTHRNFTTVGSWDGIFSGRNSMGKASLSISTWQKINKWGEFRKQQLLLVLWFHYTVHSMFLVRTVLGWDPVVPLSLQQLCRRGDFFWQRWLSGEESCTLKFLGYVVYKQAPLLRWWCVRTLHGLQNVVSQPNSNKKCSKIALRAMPLSEQPKCHIIVCKLPGPSELFIKPDGNQSKGGEAEIRWLMLKSLSEEVASVQIKLCRCYAGRRITECPLSWKYRKQLLTQVCLPSRS